ncbi:MAG: hypothetical protein M3Z18_02175 [Gemmatimonadota bacterium]|nr:hypothetical protein [Gemmatimonadota bacterium]
MRRVYLLISLAVSLGSPLSVAEAQRGYEFEVYDAQLTKPGTTEFELNTNFVASGPKQIDAGLFPTAQMLRSSLEIGTGLTNWLEASIYFLAAHRPNVGESYVGNRIRMTASAPVDWNLPVEFGLTQEVGYARPGFAENRWTYELSPMIGKTWGSIAVVANPAFERSLSGPAAHPFEFEPRGRISYGFGEAGSASLEYYSSLGPTSRFDPRSEQKHQVFVAIEKLISEQWGMAASFGRGLTVTSDRAVVATRLEYRRNR